ncbi:MAG: mannose-1-phosphate guanylyltransferase/mannose-6-phosphate isomerase [Gammaproteobacteria bacterium]|nr:mannose-1-phosphate guanylyltransferase/mannose-6-phosphate isomerase [Gammaproteobacteria bacterium]
MKLCPVILAGGGGTRLWPLSREYYAKQFLRLFSNLSLLQETLLRLDGLEREIELINPIVVCNETHRFLVAEQAEEIGKRLRSIILEPEGRNTAPALTIAAVALLENNEDPVMVMMPADHIVIDNIKFQNAIKAGYQLAADDRFVIFGVKPGHAETGYGYIKYGEQISSNNSVDINEIAGFTEKPAAELARSYLDSGDYLWNSGIFMMKASIWCREIEHLQPDIYRSCLKAYRKGSIDNQFYRLDRDAFLKCPRDSIDYSVMEKLKYGKGKSLTAVVSLDAGWSDIGAWSSVWELGKRDDNNNFTLGDVIQEGTKDSLINADNRLVAALGCDNLVIVETADVVMVARKDKAQDIKKIVERLKIEQREERLIHHRVYRPWGSYETIDSGDNYQVKRITVKPGKKISMQLHHKRAEHWVVVSGTATVTKGEEVFQLRENESAYIPIETKHRLENATDASLEIIEVQSGSYLGEDDIVRFEDDYGRQTKQTK